MKVCIIDRSIDKAVPAIIAKVKTSDFDSKIDSKRFSLPKWHKGNAHEIYKISKGSSILGLMLVYPEIPEINQLEVSSENVGKSKRYDNIAGCLIAFACYNSLLKMSGEIKVFSTSKTKNIYLTKYGMENYTEYILKSTKANSKKLVEKYLSIDTSLL